MPLLHTLRIEVTQRCPLACSHCSVIAGPARTGTMATAVAVRLIREFAELGGSRLTITGGEPLDHSGLNDILREARGQRLRSEIFSMGVVSAKGGPTVVPLQHLAALAPLVDVWWVSIHGARAEDHDALTRTPGSHGMVLEVIGRLQDARIPVNATTVVTPATIGNLRDTAALCAGRGVKELRVLTVVAQGRAANRSHPTIDPEEFEAALADLRDYPIPGLSIRGGEATRAMNGFAANCRAPEQELVVGWNGWVSVCHALEPGASAFAFDNVFDGPLSYILENSPRIQGAMAQYRAGNGCQEGCAARLAASPPAAASA